MQDRDDTETCAQAADGGEAFLRDGWVMAVTAINYRGRVLTVVSRSDTACGSAQEMGPISFTTTILSEPLGQLSWTAETWMNSLRNHETAVGRLISRSRRICDFLPEPNQ
jgi:hypothetical protein